MGGVFPFNETSKGNIYAGRRVKVIQTVTDLELLWPSRLCYSWKKSRSKSVVLRSAELNMAIVQTGMFHQLTRLPSPDQSFRRPYSTLNMTEIASVWTQLKYVLSKFALENRRNTATSWLDMPIKYLSNGQFCESVKFPFWSCCITCCMILKHFRQEGPDRTGLI